MPTADQVRALLDSGHSYETAARELGVAPGLVFMIATGRPADGGDVPADPPSFNPTTNPQVLQWVKQRAERERSDRDA